MSTFVFKALKAHKEVSDGQGLKAATKSQGFDSKNLGVGTEKEVPLSIPDCCGHAAAVPGLGLGSELACEVSWVGVATESVLKVRTEGSWVGGYLERAQPDKLLKSGWSWGSSGGETQGEGASRLCI